MKKVHLLLLFILIFSLKNYAQTLEWAKRMGGTGYDFGNSMTIDASGNVYTTGRFDGTTDFDPGPGTFNLTPAGSGEIFISKLDASGNFVWAKAMGGTSMDVGLSIAVDASGNVYTTGDFGGTADFDPGTGTFNLTPAGGYDIFISKLNAAGNFVWAKRMGGINDDNGYSIAVDASGNVYTTGYFVGTADFDPGTGTFNLISAGLKDIFISKLDASGNFVYAKSMGATNDDEGRSITLDALGNVYTTGSFQGNADFDPGAGTFNLTSAGLMDIFISKLDASGNFVYAKSMGGINGDEGRSIAIDASGNIYTTGRFQGTADFEMGTGTYYIISAGGYDIFVSKLNSSGDIVWAKSMGGTGDDEGRSIDFDASGNVYTTGCFYVTADFDPGAGTFNLTSAGYPDIFISKLNSSGNFVWAKRIGGTGDDYGYSISIDASGNIYTSGHFYATVDFDTEAGTFNLSSAGSWDIFVHKMSQTTGLSENELLNTINVYPNPTSGIITITNNEFPIKTNISVFDLQGNQITNYNFLNQGSIELNLNTLTKGIYLIKIQTDKDIETKKLIIQ